MLFRFCFQQSNLAGYIPRASRKMSSSYNGRSNGRSDSFLDYQSSGQHSNERCCHKLWHCLRGSAKYRDMKMQCSLSSVNSVSALDQISRFLFPLAFLIVHVIYWTFYLRQNEWRHHFLLCHASKFTSYFISYPIQILHILLHLHPAPCCLISLQPN